MGDRTEVHEISVPGDYAPTPAEAWAKICRETGLRTRVEKVGSEFDWTDFALNCEAAIGLLAHERQRLARKVQELGGDPR